MDLQPVVQLPKVLDQTNLIRYLPLIARVRAHIWQSVPPWIEADDLIQVGAQTLAEMGHIPPDVRNEEAWLWTIIERAMWSYVRSECTEAHDVLVEERPAEVETIEDQLIRRDERQHVRRAVRTLPPAERHVITMRLAGRKQGDIAVQAGVSRQRVGFLESRAVTRMRRALVPLAAAAA